MKSNSIFFTTLMLAAPAALWLQGSALAQSTGGNNTPLLAEDPGPRAGALAPDFRANVVFYFHGGSPRDFVRAIDEQYKVDWSSVAHIPADMLQVIIPSLRLGPESVDQRNFYGNGVSGRGIRAGGSGGGVIGPGGTGGGGRSASGLASIGGGGGLSRSAGAAAAGREPLQSLVALYNTLEQTIPGLGQLRVEGDFSRPSIVIFQPPATAGPLMGVKMMAFSLQGIPDGEWQNLAETARNDLYRLARDQGSRDLLQVEVVLHRDTGLLVVIGPDSMLQAAETLVSAWRNHPAPAPAPAPPNPPRPAAPAAGQN
jgi:hypothetical protein